MTTRSDDHLENAGVSQKLEWVTPKISLMDAGDTEGKQRIDPEGFIGTGVNKQSMGPS